MRKSYYVVRWKKSSGWYEQDFNNYGDAFNHYKFEMDNVVVEECVLIERTDDVIIQEKTGSSNGK